MSSKYEASASMLGYLYQCREALLLAILESRNFPGLSISIERFDDVTFEENEAPLKQIQLKHHTKAGNLSDASTDLWKTLRIWSEQVASDPQLPFQRRFVILTTATAPENSAAAKLRIPRASNFDEDDALKLLMQAATSSKNKDTAKGRELFLDLPEQDRRNLLSAIHVHDRAPTITDARHEIEEKLTFAAPARFVSQLVDRLEGWWFNQVILSLVDTASPPLSLLTLRAKIDEIATAFRTGDLLLSQEAQIVSSQDIAASDSHTFVKQMRCIGISETAIDLGKRDFYKATAQRSAWARENVLLDGESQRYDEALVDRWSRERLALESGKTSLSEEQKRDLGRTLFHWANRHQMPFRNRHELWLCTGSYQILADTVRVGWHPDHETMFRPRSAEKAA